MSENPAGDLGPPLPTVSVIVPVHNDVERLRQCVDLLRRQDYPPDRYDVIVVDNDSTDDIASAVPADPRFRLVREGRRGSYAARNAGAAVATGEVLAFTDADCRPRADWLRAGVAVLNGNLRPDAVGGAIEMVFRNGKAPGSGPEHYDAYDGLPQQEHFIATYPFAATANMFVRAEAFDAAGPFDAAFASGGDREWGARLAAIGGVFAYAPDAVVDHPTRSTWAELTRKSRRIAHGMADLDAAQPVHAALLGIAVEALGGLYFYAELWTWDQPSRPRQKLAFAAAFCWARGLRTAIRLRRLLLRGMSGRRGARHDCCEEGPWVGGTRVPPGRS